MVVSAERLQQGWNVVSGLPSFPLFCSYLVMVLLSSAWPKVSHPLGLRPVLIVHNFACCLASLVSLLWFAWGVAASGTLYDKHPSALLQPCFSLYWLTKCLELLDTVFMILRHRWRQISFLHVYHHSSMLLLSDVARMFYPWPAIAFYLAMNCLVHVFLYLYYGLSALRPNSPPQWKRRMTELQIVQFVIGFFVALHGYLHHGFCIYSMLYGVTMTVLFSHFYYNAYLKARKSKKLE